MLVFAFQRPIADIVSKVGSRPVDFFHSGISGLLGEADIFTESRDTEDPATTGDDVSLPLICTGMIDRDLFRFELLTRPARDFLRQERQLSASR